MTFFEFFEFLFYRKLRRFLNKYKESPTIRKAFVDQMEKYFDGKTTHEAFLPAVERNELYTLATLLDPRFKHKVILIVIILINYFT